MDAQSAGIRAVEKVGRPAHHEGRSYPGFNLFRTDDLNIFQAIVRGEFTISGLRNRDLQVRLNKTAGQVSRLLKRLRLHGFIKKIGRTYKYYLPHPLRASRCRLRPAPAADHCLARPRKNRLCLKTSLPICTQFRK